MTNVAETEQVVKRCFSMLSMSVDANEEQLVSALITTMTRISI